jgi:threonine/homoserine/homoserine lactone efflux protein
LELDRAGASLYAIDVFVTPRPLPVDQSLLPLIAFTATSALTPGPNNILLMTSGVNFGFRRTVPHILGVVVGFPAMVALIGVGIGATILTQPLVHQVVTIVGVLYLLWLAWQIASADVTPNEGRLLTAEPVAGSKVSPAQGRPMSFLAAAAFQWVNAKAWISAIGMLAIYAPTGYGVMGGIAIVVGINLIISIVSATTWTAFGLALARWLGNPLRRRLFNLAMATLLVLTLVPALRELSGL